MERCQERLYNPDMSIAVRLKEARQRSGKSQSEVAAALNVSVQAVSQWETGKNGPSLINLESLALMYTVDLEWLLRGQENGSWQLAENSFKPGRRAPVVEWADLTKILSSNSVQHKGLSGLEPSFFTSQYCLSLKIEDDSMLPRFEIGDLIIVDVFLLPEPGDFIILSEEFSERCLLRQMYVTADTTAGGHMVEFRPLNAAYPSIFTSWDKLLARASIATLVEQRRLRPAFRGNKRRLSSGT